MILSLTFAFTNTEYNEILIDMNMLIQEKLVNIKDKTALSVLQPWDNGRKKSNQPKNDGNMTMIVKAARSNGLNDKDIEELFADLEEDEHRCFSINEAVPKIVEMSKKYSSIANQNNEMRLSNSVHPFSDLIGKRVKRVMEDGVEYDGEYNCSFLACFVTSAILR